MNDQFVPGQRWINDAQLELGLGSVLTTDFRTVTVIFLATGETFVYAKQSVPLTRVRFAPGDSIITHDDAVYEVLVVEERNGLITYTARDSRGVSHNIEESLLSNFIQLSRPTERLFNGQIDGGIWFDLRYRTRRQQARLSADPLRGLAGGRVSLIPHQLYIAHTVARRFAPRVLLADEVGLGKTIEAGMIVHQQLVTERAARVLVIVPESLVHQWLVEMLRRFNLMFRIFDEQRFNEFMESAEDDLDFEQENPFESEQLVLCSLEFLSSRPEVFKSCRDAGWDLMVVDEAHHLDWSEDDPGFEYQLVEQLAGTIPGVLLLTATPEQLGKSGHYARLRLLDPDRFPSFQGFMAEEEGYQPIAEIVEHLLDGENIQSELLTRIGQYLGDLDETRVSALEDSDPQVATAAREQLIADLLDRHGTGRVLFRNTRATVAGFPDRKVHVLPLPAPREYRELLEQFADSGISDAQLLLCPELLYSAAHEHTAASWVNLDPRVDALYQLVSGLRPQKVLAIAASSDTAIELAEHLKARYGMDVALFHEHLSMLDRDRAAAWFADQISGPRLMICSEIGSEGRNFQFSHNLALFDLPLNPDLLEQRIGRLDRIGQKETVNIHILYLENSAQEFMYRWYHQGLNAFEQTCPTGFAVFRDMEDKLLEQLHHPHQNADTLIMDSRAMFEKYSAELQSGRDRLLEFNSCRPAIANSLQEEAKQADEESGLQQYMELVYDCFGVDNEIHSENCYAVNAGPHMAVPFPQLPEDGITVTYDRTTALVYEDIDFLTWEHPLVRGAMDIVLAGEAGNTSVIAASIPETPRGTIVLESIFILEPYASQGGSAARFLSPRVIRIMIDQSGKRLDRHASISS